MKSKKIFMGLVLINLLVMGMFMGVALADEGGEDSDNDGVEDEIEDNEEREVEIEDGEGEITIKSELKNGDKVNELEIKIFYEEDDGIGAKLSYESEYESEDEEEDENKVDESEDTETQAEEIEIEFEIVFHSLIEYVDQDGDNIYDPANDEFIKELVLNSFQTPTYTKETLKDETLLHTINITSTDGIFTFIAYISEEHTKVNGELISPAEMKIDLVIKGFNYDNDSSQLALHTRLESETDYEEENDTEDEEEGYAENETGYETTNNGEYGFFTWKKSALIDGENTEVLASKATTDEDYEDEQKVYLNYQRGTTIIHDPKIGVIFNPSESMGLNLVAILSVAGIFSIAAILGIVYFLRRRGR